jgi:LEA14-like dessication related protein
MVKRLSMRAAALVAALALLAGCGSVKEPEIEFQGLQLAGVGLGGGTVLVNLEVKNPNRFGFTAEDLDYELFLRNPSAGEGDSAWTRIAAGRYDERFEVGSFDTRALQIPVQFTFSSLGGAGRQILQTGSVQYRATGSVNVKSGLGSRRLPFRKTGTAYMNGTVSR